MKKRLVVAMLLATSVSLLGCIRIENPGGSKDSSTNSSMTKKKKKRRRGQASGYRYYAQRNNFQKAMSSVELAYQQNSNDPRISQDYQGISLVINAMSLAQAGDYQQAITLIDNSGILINDPTNIAAQRLGDIKASLELGEYPEEPEATDSDDESGDSGDSQDVLGEAQALYDQVFSAYDSEDYQGCIDAADAYDAYASEAEAALSADDYASVYGESARGKVNAVRNTSYGLLDEDEEETTESSAYESDSEEETSDSEESSYDDSSYEESSYDDEIDEDETDDSVDTAGTYDDSADTGYGTDSLSEY